MDTLTETVCHIHGTEKQETDCVACGGDGSVDLHELWPLEYSRNTYGHCANCGGSGMVLYCPDCEEEYDE